MKKIISYFSAINLLSIFLHVKEAKAFSIMGETSPGCLSDGNCGLNDFVKLGIAGTKVFLGLAGSMSLLFFIYGGVMFLISGGNQERVSKGKQIIIGSVIGIIVIFTSYTIIGFVLGALGISNTANWFTVTPFGKK